MTPAAECRTFGTPAPAVGREDGGVARSSRMTPARAANLLRSHADAIEAAGEDVLVTLQVRALDGGAPRSASDRMASTRARRRLENATDQLRFDASGPEIPPGPPKQKDPSESANREGSNGETTDQKARAGAPAREAARDVAVAAPGSATQRKRARLTERPENWAPNEGHRRRASELGVDVTFQADQFCSFHDSKGNLFVNWDRAFWTWLGNAREFSKGGSGGRPARPTDIRQRTLPGEFDLRSVLGKANGAAK